MCHVLIICAQDLNKEDQKEFREKVRLEIRQTKTNPVIEYILGSDRKSKKKIANYLKKHPKAEVKNIEYVPTEEACV